MKKIFFGLVLFFALNPVHAGDYFVVGVDYFNKGDYQKAAKNLETAIKISPLNVNARYYLAQTYIKQERISEAQAQYNRIIILAPSSDASKLSEKGLSLIRKSFNSGVTANALSAEDLNRYKDNYLEYVFPLGDGLKKWTAFPVKVYIEPKKNKSICQKAFMQWQERTGKLVSFVFVPTPQEAQIILTFRDKLENTATKETYIAGLSKPYYNGKNIEKSEIKILSIDPNTHEDISPEFIYFATLHEVGHSLGMKGHSPNENDVMFAKSEKAKTELTQRDLNTISLFYKIDEKTLAEKKKNGYDVQLQQAINYANSSPDKTIGWSNLADLYYSKKMYAEAIKNYKKALAIEPENDGYNLNTGVAYLSMNDKTNALKYIKKAYDLDSQKTINIYWLGQAYFEAGQIDTGRACVLKYIQEHPENASDDKIKALKKTYNL